MRIAGFVWDDGNVLRLALGHGIEPEDVEEVFARAPCFRRTRRGHRAAFGPMSSGRLLVIVFAIGPGAVARAITGWDMDTAERRYYRRQRGS
jgi:uncharacterized DUF497 family protein